MAKIACRWHHLLIFTLCCTLAVAGWLLYGQRPMLLGLGLGLTAAAPLAYLLYHLLRPETVTHHPVLISVVSGLGCVMVMVGIQRFGDQHQWILWLGLAALAAWMAYQRYILRRSEF